MTPEQRLEWKKKIVARRDLKIERLKLELDYWDSSDLRAKKSCREVERAVDRLCYLQAKDRLVVIRLTEERTLARSAERDQIADGVAAVAVEVATPISGTRADGTTPLATGSKPARAGRRLMRAMIDEEVARRRAIVKQHPETPADRLCRIFDERRVPLPKGWPFEKWGQAYNKDPKYRQRIHVIISRDRKAHT